MPIGKLHDSKQKRSGNVGVVARQKYYCLGQLSTRRKKRRRKAKTRNYKKTRDCGLIEE